MRTGRKWPERVNMLKRRRSLSYRAKQGRTAMCFLEGAWTTVSGRLFHAATTRNEKKVCLMKVCALSLKIFLPCPRRVFAGSTVKNLLAKPCSNRACSEKDRFGESQIPKSFLASILVMSSGPFSPCMTKEFAESPPNDIWTHFSSFRGRCQSNDHCFAASTSIWRALALELHDFKSSAKSRHGLERTSGSLWSRGTCGTRSNAFEKSKNMASDMSPSSLAWVKLSINTSMFVTQERFGRNPC
ncbi:hypothetical protein CSKR_111138 [Clonorchis sinensis]|uniref:Uncharacterized protein n=1 Tax=Clonorchis sinensis TaxID=79923 RepID=A0A3R7H4M5_CLOSI|nr:hypothetical protein CSKR_111138 [Clonorchis sinensis]